MQFEKRKRKEEGGRVFLFSFTRRVSGEHIFHAARSTGKMVDKANEKAQEGNNKIPSNDTSRV